MLAKNSFGEIVYNYYYYATKCAELSQCTLALWRIHTKNVKKYIY